MTNHIDSTKGPIKGGFNRKAFYQASEQVFDKVFNYERDFKDSWEYQYTMKHGSEKDIAQLLTKQELKTKGKIISLEKAKPIKKNNISNEININSD